MCMTCMCVNALKRATAISTDNSKHAINTTNSVSMPFNGLHSFLLKQAGFDIDGDLIVSMPLNGLTSFLRLENRRCNVRVCVSMPLNGLTSFLP